MRLVRRTEWKIKAPRYHYGSNVYDIFQVQE
jgi:hypothetical protein